MLTCNIPTTSYLFKTRVNQFVTEALWQAEHTRGTNSREVMMTFGTDFQYENAAECTSTTNRIYICILFF